VGGDRARALRIFGPIGALAERYVGLDGSAANTAAKLAQILWACAALGIQTQAEPFVQAAGKLTPKQLDQFVLGEIADLAWACTKLRSATAPNSAIIPTLTYLAGRIVTNDVVLPATEPHDANCNPQSGANVCETPVNHCTAATDSEHASKMIPNDYSAVSAGAFAPSDNDAVAAAVDERLQPFSTAATVDLCMEMANDWDRLALSHVRLPHTRWCMPFGPLPSGDGDAHMLVKPVTNRECLNAVAA
jgi:hypothetical protein